jgi:hypothetical protein
MKKIMTEAVTTGQNESVFSINIMILINKNITLNFLKTQKLAVLLHNK